MATIVSGSDLVDHAIRMGERVANDQLTPAVEDKIARTRMLVQAHGAGEVTPQAALLGDQLTEAEVTAVVELLLDARAVERNRVIAQADTGAGVDRG